MDKCKKLSIDDAICLVDWDISLSLHGDDDFNIILKGTIKDDSSFENNSENIVMVLIYDRENINIVHCIDNKFYKLESEINFHQMREYGYTLEFIECFKYGFPSNWVLLFDELYSQYKNSVNSFIFSRNLINEAIDEMEDFEQSKKLALQESQDIPELLSKNEELKHLHVIESDVITDTKMSFFSPSKLIISPLLNEKNSHIHSKINLSLDKKILESLILKEPGLPLVISTPKVDDSQRKISNVSPLNLSPILADSSVIISNQKKEFEKTLTLVSSITGSNNDGTQCTTDFFAATNNFDSFSEVRKPKVDKQGKRKILSSPENTPRKDDKIEKKPKKKQLKKKRLDEKKKFFSSFNDDNVIKDINNISNVQDLFDATLGLSDLENTTRGRFNFTNDSVVGTSMSEGNLKTIDNENKNLVYYLPSGKHIFKTKTKPKKVEKKPSEDNPFDFERLVYEEIEENKAFESHIY